MDQQINPSRILVIDDDVGLREMLSLVLQRKGFLVMTASDGNEGVRMFRENPFDLVVTDLIMPEKEGIETILEIRSLKQPVRIIAMSGGGRVHQSMHLHLAESVGADRVLSKPFMPEDFTAIVGELLALPARS